MSKHDITTATQAQSAPFDFVVLNSVVCTQSVRGYFPDDIHIGVFPNNFEGYRIYSVRARKESSSMQLHLDQYLPPRHRTIRVVAVSEDASTAKFTVICDSTTEAKRNEVLYNITGNVRWQGDVVVIKHAGADDRIFENITTKDMDAVMSYLREMKSDPE